MANTSNDAFPKTKNNPSSRHKGVVYFITLGELVTIGYSTNVTRRFEELRLAAGSATRMRLIGSFAAPRHRKKLLHRRFADEHQGRDWFVASERITRYMARKFNVMFIVP